MGTPPPPPRRSSPRCESHGVDGKIEDLPPAQRLVLHREGKRWFILRPSDGKMACLGFPNPVLVVRTKDNVYGVWEAYVYQRGCIERLAKCHVASEFLSRDYAFTVRGNGTDAQLARRHGFKKSLHHQRAY